MGLMGTVAKAVADGGCDVTGFLPEFFTKRGKCSKNILCQPIFNPITPKSFSCSHSPSHSPISAL